MTEQKTWFVGIAFNARKRPDGTLEPDQKITGTLFTTRPDAGLTPAEKVEMMEAIGTVVPEDAVFVLHGKLELVLPRVKENG